MNRFNDEEYHCYKDFEFLITDNDIEKLKQGKILYSDVDEEYTVILKYYEGGKMNKEDYQEVLEEMEKATGNEVFCDVMCRFPYELNEEQLTEVCERCPLNNTLDQIVDDIRGSMKREEAIAYFKRHIELYCVEGISRESEEMAIKALEQQKTGHWIEDAKTYYKELNKRGLGVDEYTPYFTDDIACSECLAKYSMLDNETQFFKHCPNCGAMMTDS